MRTCEGQRDAVARCPEDRGSRGGTSFSLRDGTARAPDAVIAWCFGVFRRFATSDRRVCLPRPSASTDHPQPRSEQGRIRDEQVEQQQRAVRRATDREAGAPPRAGRQEMCVPGVRDGAVDLQHLTDVLGPHDGDAQTSARAQHQPDPLARRQEPRVAAPTQEARWPPREARRPPNWFVLFNR